MADIFVCDVGKVIRLTVRENGAVVNVSGASTKQIKIKKPDGTTLAKGATFTTDGTDGKVQYVVESGVFSQPGLYEFRAYLVLGAWTGHSSKKVAEIQSV